MKVLKSAHTRVQVIVLRQPKNSKITYIAIFKMIGVSRLLLLLGLVFNY